MRYLIGIATSIALATITAIVLMGPWQTNTQDNPNAVVHAAIGQACSATSEVVAFDSVGVVTIIRPNLPDETLTYQSWIDGADSQQHVYRDGNLAYAMILKDYYAYSRNYEREDSAWAVSGPHGPGSSSSTPDIVAAICGESMSPSPSYSEAFLQDLHSGELGTFDYNGDLTIDGVRVRHYTLNAEASAASVPTPTPSVTYVWGDFTKLNPEGPFAPPIYEEVWVRPSGHLYQLSIRYDGNLPWYQEGSYAEMQWRFSGWGERNPIQAPIATPTPAPSITPTPGPTPALGPTPTSAPTAMRGVW